MGWTVSRGADREGRARQLTSTTARSPRARTTPAPISRSPRASSFPDVGALSFSLLNGAQSLVDRTVTNGADAQAFFANPLDLGAFAPEVGPSLLDLRFSMRMVGASRFTLAGVAFDVTRSVVPEPGVALLVGLGLGALATARRSG